jgi:hypothetical protein
MHYDVHLNKIHFVYITTHTGDTAYSKHKSQALCTYVQGGHFYIHIVPYLIDYASGFFTEINLTKIYSNKP